MEERVPPGKSEIRHLHAGTQQCFYVLVGEAVIEAEGTEFLLRAGDSLAVPAGAPHQFLNRGQDEVRFLVISQPAVNGDRIPA
ncbi:MAG: cupin domain-containing protein [Moraxellaceae bacterium]|nr:cupin domain-containing protein [Moraxellaceae bacterium]